MKRSWRGWSGLVLGLGLASLGTGTVTGAGQASDLRAECRAAIRRAGEYYASKVARHGGYVYHTSLDLTQRWGEGEATPDQIWVQPPATPTVGLAFLRAHEATGDANLFAAARKAADALVHGQLKSGGWTNAIDFDPAGGRLALNRNGKGKGRNQSSLDDGITQAALSFLIQADEAMKFQHSGIHEAVEYGMSALLRAQFPNGAFPQGWAGPVSSQPVLRASYPKYDWRTEGRIDNYWDAYTLNDGLVGYLDETLRQAHRVYGSEKYRTARLKLGDFLLLAQMPEPQPAWAQQYSYAMHPIWARRFEPAAVTGGESQDAVRVLMRIYRQTKDPKYLAPIPAALAYLKRSRLPDGRLARYYELQTNRPLYMRRSGRDYTLTHDDSQLPDHYGWKVEAPLEELEREYEVLRAGRTEPRRSEARELGIRKILGELDGEGRWVSSYRGERLVGQPRFQPGFRYLSSERFSQNLTQLADYLGATAR